MVDAALDKRTRPLITPEGVDLRVRLASVGERFAALSIDLAIMLTALIVLSIAAGSAAGALGFDNRAEWVAIIWLIGFFVLRSFYFTLFECGARAATPGKRVLGLRVAARDGGALGADAIVARNAMRELELFLPMGAMFARASDVEAWGVLFGIIWCFIFALFPFFNRDHLRVGDVVAGTWVIKTPKPALLPDLAGEPAAAAPRFGFSEKQLDVYGVKELQVLEQVLRGGQQAASDAVAQRIRAKINWPYREDEADLDFLSAYYHALRRRLESRLLFGVRKADKHDRTR